jgi:hypothetical protein
MDTVSFSENVLLHFRIPTPRLVAKVNASLQKLLHCDFDSQSTSSLKGMLKNALQRQHPFLPALAGRDLARISSLLHFMPTPPSWRAAKLGAVPRGAED